MQRRDFIKTSCAGCAGILGVGTLFGLLNGCAPLTVLRAGASEKKITVPTGSFKEAQNLLIIKSPGLEFDILLVKKKDATYNALYMQCTHQNQPLSANKSGLFCSSHGSAFDLDGNVTIQPATEPLRKFKTESDASYINIYLT